MRAAAQYLANLDVVRQQAASAQVPASMSAYAQQFQDRVDATSVQVADLDGEVLFGASPDDAGERMPLHTEPADRVTTWTGDLDVDGEHSIAVQVPLYAPDEVGEPPRQVGIVMVTDVYPSVADRAQELLPDLVTFLGIGLGLGLLGAWLLARLIKRRTRGLEPAEIATLADQREALLHCDPRGRRRGRHRRHGHGAQRQCPRAASGCRRRRWAARSTSWISIPACARRWSGTTRCRTGCWCSASGWWCSTATGCVNRGRQVGTVTTLRDRTELMAMQSELDGAREHHRDAARPDPRVQQPAAHDLGAGPARGVRRGVARDRRADPAPGRDQRGRDQAGAGPGRGSAAGGEGEPRRGARRGDRARARRTRCPASTRSCPPTSAPCSATWSTTPSTRPWPRGANGSTYDSVLERGEVVLRVADTGAGRAGGGHGRRLPPRLHHQARRRRRAWRRAGARAGGLRAARWPGVGAQ